MDIKDILYTTLIAILVFVFGHYLLPSQARFGDSVIETNQTDFQNGLKVGGSEFVNASRAVSAGTISGTTITGSGTATLNALTVTNSSASTSVTLGDNTYKSLCLKAYTTSGLAYVYFSTSSVNGAVVVTTTKPIMCP